MKNKPVTIGTVIWPDEDTQRAANRIREWYDPHRELIAPHMTFIFPMNAETALEDLAASLAKAVEDVSPFDVRLNRVSSINMLAADWPAGTATLLPSYPNSVDAIFLLADEGLKEILKVSADPRRCQEVVVRHPIFPLCSSWIGVPLPVDVVYDDHILPKGEPLFNEY